MLPAEPLQHFELASQLMAPHATGKLGGTHRPPRQNQPGPQALTAPSLSLQHEEPASAQRTPRVPRQHVAALPPAQKMSPHGSSSSIEPEATHVPLLHSVPRAHTAASVPPWQHSAPSSMHALVKLARQHSELKGQAACPQSSLQAPSWHSAPRLAQASSPPRARGPQQVAAALTQKGPSGPAQHFVLPPPAQVKLSQADANAGASSFAATRSIASSHLIAPRRLAMR